MGSGLRRTVGVAFVLVLSVSVACGGEDDAASENDEVAEAELAVDDERGVVYLADDEGEWTLRVTWPEADGPWPLIVVIPPGNGANSSVDRNLAERGAVVVSGENWATDGAFTTDPNPHLYGTMDRAACIVSWAQAHAAEYGGDPALTTVTGYSGGAMAATWAGLGLADDSRCDDPIVHLPVALAPGESQFLFQHSRWDPAFESGDPEPRATLDGLLNPERWTVSPDLRVGLWSATNAIGETREIENPPAADSWIWLRNTATPVVDDLAAVGALEDQLIDWRDNALLMELRLQGAGIDVRNEVYDIPHAYTDEVYDLIFAIQPETS